MTGQPLDWQELTNLTQGRPFVVERVRLAANGVAIEGEFELPQLAQLSAEDQVFVTAFVTCHGSIKQMEKIFGVSYPTIKSRLNRITQKLDFVETDVDSEIPPLGVPGLGSGLPSGSGSGSGSGLSGSGGPFAGGPSVAGSSGAGAPAAGSSGGGSSSGGRSSAGSEGDGRSPAGSGGGGPSPAGSGGGGPSPAGSDGSGPSPAGAGAGAGRGGGGGGRSPAGRAAAGSGRPSVGPAAASVIDRLRRGEITAQQAVAELERRP
jgi:hypothetical protein